MTLEEAFLLASYLKALSANATFALGPVRVVGHDDHYPKDIHGRPVEPAKFTIRAEKAPNRRGVEMILNHFAGGVATLGDVLGRAGERRCRRRLLVGGDPRGWITDEQAAALEKRPDRDRSRHFRLPGHAASDDRAGWRLLRRTRRHVRQPRRPGPGHRAGGPWTRRVAAGRTHFVGAHRTPRLVQRGCALPRDGEAIPALAPLAQGDLGEQGVRLVRAAGAATT